jgi:hypothetical protein
MPDGSWRQRGREATRTGAIAEDASLRETRALAARARNKRIVSLGEQSQYRGGKGFDEVYFEFDSAGRARVVIVEVKNYPGRYVPFSEFTAVAHNVGDNMARLRRQITDELALPANQRTLGLSDAELRAIRNALRNQDVALEIRLAPGTRLGSFTRGDVIAQIKRAWREAGIRSRVPVRTRRISGALMDEARVSVQNTFQRDKIGTVPRFFKVADAAEGRGIVQGPYRHGPDEVFFDTTNRPLRIHTVDADLLALRDTSAVAAKIVDSLRRKIPLPGTSQQAPLNVLLDTAGLMGTTRRELHAAIEDAIKDAGIESVILNRLHTIF